MKLRLTGPDIEIVRRRLQYDPISGAFEWRSPKRLSGREAGTITPEGYRQIHIGAGFWRAHHLAWLLMTGTWPARCIDHANGVRCDNRWENLRLATSQQNSANSRRFANNTSGYKGVSRHPVTGRWRAIIYFERQQIYLGSHDSAAAAHAVYLKRARELFGEFARSA